MMTVRSTLSVDYSSLHHEFIAVTKLKTLSRMASNGSEFSNWVRNYRIPRSIAAVLVDVAKDLLIDNYLKAKRPELIKCNGNKVDVETTWMNMLNTFNEREMLVIFERICGESDNIVAKFESNKKYFNKINEDCYDELRYEKSNIAPCYSKFIIKTNYGHSYLFIVISDGWQKAKDAMIEDIKQYTKKDNYDYLF